METKDFKERVNYIRDESGILVGSSVNYPLIIQADDIDELKVKMSAMLKMWIKHAEKIAEQEEPFEFREMNRQEWDGMKDNITYWEIDRFKRLMATREDFRTEILIYLVNEGMI